MSVKNNSITVSSLVISLLSFLISLNDGYAAGRERTKQIAQPRAVVRLRATLNTDSVKTSAFSPVSRLIAVGYKDQTVQLWDVANGKLQRTLTGFKEPPAMYWSPDGLRLLTTNSGKTASIWDAQTGKRLCELTGLQHDIRDVEWSPNGKAVMTVIENDSMKANFLGKEKTEVQLWDAETGRLKFTLVIKGLFVGAKFSPDGQQILTTGDKEDAKLWDALTGQLKATLRPPHRSIFTGASFAFSPNGRFIAANSYGRGIYLWEADTGKLQATVVEQDFGKNDYSLRGFSPDGKLFVLYREHLKGFGKTESSVELRDGVTGELRGMLTGRNMRDSTHQLVWSHDCQTLVTAGGSHKYEGKLWDVATGRLIATFPMLAKEGHMPLSGIYYNDLDGLSFHPRLPILMATNNNFIRFWNPVNGELLQTIENPGSNAQWSADGQLLLTISKDQNFVQIWELAQK
jgi:WD40 repeat protein